MLNKSKFSRKTFLLGVGQNCEATLVGGGVGNQFEPKLTGVGKHLEAHLVGFGKNFGANPLVESDGW